MTRRKALLTAALVTAATASALAFAAYRAVGTFPVALPITALDSGPGGLVAAERIGAYPRVALQTLLDRAGLPDPVTVANGATLYRLRYRTTNHDGAPVVASGLVALPNTRAPRSAVAYFHGTNAQRNSAPSQKTSQEGLLATALVSGAGHLLLAPDYIGLGESRDVHPYLHTTTTVETCVDLLKASHGLLGALGTPWPESLYLMGFSQGGHATLAVQRALEKLEDPRFTVAASAPVAGPFNLRDISFPQALTGQTDSHVYYLAYLASAYAAVYEQPIDSLLAKPYADTVPVLFDGDHESDFISTALPENPRELFVPEFLAACDNGTAHWFLDALAENSIRDWTPKAPVKIYFGEDDVDVLPEEARSAERELRGRGADVTAVSVGPWDHNTSILRAVPLALKWFATLEPNETQADAK